jgi:hypothetical protein
MFEEKLRIWYQALQDSIRVSAELKQKTLAYAREAGRVKALDSVSGHPVLLRQP